MLKRDDDGRLHRSLEKELTPEQVSFAEVVGNELAKYWLAMNGDRNAKPATIQADIVLAPTLVESTTEPTR